MPVQINHITIFNLSPLQFPCGLTSASLTRASNLCLFTPCIEIICISSPGSLLHFQRFHWSWANKSIFAKRPFVLLQLTPFTGRQRYKGYKGNTSYKGLFSFSYHCCLFHIGWLPLVIIFPPMLPRNRFPWLIHNWLKLQTICVKNKNNQTWNIHRA